MSHVADSVEQIFLLLKCFLKSHFNTHGSTETNDENTVKNERLGCVFHDKAAFDHFRIRFPKSKEIKSDSDNTNTN